MVRLSDLTASHPTFCEQWLYNGWEHLEHCACASLRYLLGHELLCVVRLYELHRESPGNCCIRATLEQHHGYVIWGYVVAMSLLHYNYVMAVATAAASASREAMLWLLCQSGENKCVCSSYGFWVFFQPLSSCLAYSEFMYQCSVKRKTIGGVNRMKSKTDTKEIPVHSQF